jgi:hypothetical protein
MLKIQPKGEALKFGALGVPLTVDAHQYVALAHGPDVEEAVGEEEESNNCSCWSGGMLCQKVMRSRQLLLSYHILPPTPHCYSSTPPKQARPTKLTSVSFDLYRT